MYQEKIKNHLLGNIKGKNKEKESVVRVAHDYARGVKNYINSSCKKKYVTESLQKIKDREWGSNEKFKDKSLELMR